MRHRIALWTSILIALTATTFAIASSNQVKTITGCIDKKSGVLRISANCSKSETLISWNQQGIQGDVGAQGPAGVNGTDGATGPQGEQGLQGPRGSDGANGMQGPSGPAGPRGATGPSGGGGGGGLFVRDALGALVGNLIDVTGISGYSADTSTVLGITAPVVTAKVWIPNAQQVLEFTFADATVTSGWNPVYFNSDCTGPTYSTDYGDIDPRFLRVTENFGENHWFALTSVTTYDDYKLDFYYYEQGVCRRTGYGFARFALWHEVANPLAGFTFQKPLHISSS